MFLRVFKQSWGERLEDWLFKETARGLQPRPVTSLTSHTMRAATNLWESTLSFSLSHARAIHTPSKTTTGKTTCAFFYLLISGERLDGAWQIQRNGEKHVRLTLLRAKCKDCAAFKLNCWWSDRAAIRGLTFAGRHCHSSSKWRPSIIDTAHPITWLTS